ncbi:hypothetical protein COLO4_19856 [Corchorus olitorius]|uniref:RRM domain-containing protein n=1 Tax=Corchorus olitorius TaxID=93759 RepID=A0A1R3J308_9ROSI|nr:hypothetical protein COLO4_19856 [Corchorus olitorius]
MPRQPVESDERVDLDEDNDPEETMEEEVEYEEVEVEEEEEEIEEEVEEEVEEEEEEEEEDQDVDEDEKKKHAELLARPPHGSEVYIGGIPHDISQEDLKSFCESVGEVTEVRIMKGKDSSENKGFAFVTFTSVELASKAIDELNNAEFKGKRIKCSTSQSKHRLFIGNIPRSWGEEDLRKVVSEVGPGVTGLELVKDTKYSSNNRGFAFIEYYNNACAEYSRQKMMNPQFRLGDNVPNVSWADPKNADSSAASQGHHFFSKEKRCVPVRGKDGEVDLISYPLLERERCHNSMVKAVYVKNLPKDVTQDQLKKLFEHHGKITKVVLPPAKPGQERNRIGFVHFAERSCAMKALKNTEKYELDGQVVECSLAKPQADQKTSGGSSSQNSGFFPSYPPQLGYGLVGGAYGALGSGYGVPSLAQPLIYGRGAAPTSMSMMPMLLPDGRIGYVLSSQLECLVSSNQLKCNNFLPLGQLDPESKDALGHWQQPGAQPQSPPVHQRNSGRGGGKSGGGGSSSRGKHSNDSRRFRPY